MTVSLTTNEILNISTTLESLIPQVSEAPENAVTAFKVTRLLKAFLTQREMIQEQVTNLQKKHILNDEDGNPLTEEVTEGPNKGQSFTKIDVEAYNADLAPILKTKMDMEIPFLLKLDELQKEYRIDYQKLFLLDKLLEI